MSLCRSDEDAPFELYIVPCTENTDQGLRYLVFLQVQETSEIF
jgi:hypothetical protein